jgi:GntR family transcriptional repressor for pyruvate dehydrogenase complex
MRARTAAVSLSLDPMQRNSNLVLALSEAMEREIAAGRLRPGDRLPPQSQLAASTGVSRTVVREAVASLRAAGLVETRQGAGAFVLARNRIGLGGRLGPAEVEDILSVLELRLAVEAEAAALAAARRNDGHLAALDEAIAALRQAARAGGDGIASDLAFHRTLAEATGNLYFVQFLESLGELSIPRRRILASGRNAAGMKAYLEMVAGEHQAIRDAVAAHDPVLAAAAMRGHLAGSRKRYAEDSEAHAGTRSHAAVTGR